MRITFSMQSIINNLTLLVNRKLYLEVPPRVEYSLTDIGKSLIPSLEGLIKWAKENFNSVVV